MAALPDEVRDLIKGVNFSAVTTLQADGRPATQVMWIDCDDECVLINTEIHRYKYKQAKADPRVTVMIWEAGNPYRYVEVRGEVEEFIYGQRARDHIDELAWKYFGRAYDPEEITSERVIMRMRPLLKSPHARKSNSDG